MKEIIAVKMDELNFLFQGVKHLVVDEDGKPLQDDLGDGVNYGGIFAKTLPFYRTFKSPYISVGVVLTPLFANVGIDLKQHRPDLVDTISTSSILLGST